MERSLKALIGQAYWTYAQHFYVERYLQVHMVAEPQVQWIATINKYIERVLCNLSSPLVFHWHCSHCYMLVDKNCDKHCPFSFSKDNMILAGLWFGSSKPAMWVYLKPFHSALSRLERDGKVIESPYRPGILNICATLLCGTYTYFAVLSVCSLIVPWKLAKKVNLYTPSTLTEKTWRECKEHMLSFVQMLKQQSQKEKQWEESKAHVGLLVFNTTT